MSSLLDARVPLETHIWFVQHTERVFFFLLSAAQEPTEFVFRTTRTYCAAVWWKSSRVNSSRPSMQSIFSPPDVYTGPLFLENLHFVKLRKNTCLHLHKKCVWLRATPRGETPPGQNKNHCTKSVCWTCFRLTNSDSLNTDKKNRTELFLYRLNYQNSK